MLWKFPSQATRAATLNWWTGGVPDRDYDGGVTRQQANKRSEWDLGDICRESEGEYPDLGGEG